MMLAVMSTQIEMTGALEPRDGWNADRCTIAKALERDHNPLRVPDPARGVLRHDPLRRLRRPRRDQRAGRRRASARARRPRGCSSARTTASPASAPASEYRLTEKGADLFPVLVALMQWGDKWALEGGSRVELTHAGCGGNVGVSLACSEGHGVAPDHIELAVKPTRRVSPRSSTH